MGADAATAELPGHVTAALGRLQGAVARLQAAAERRAAQQSGRADRDDELAAMSADRARLADALDTALAEAQRLQGLHATLAGRIEKAEAAVSVALTRFTPVPGPDARAERDLADGSAGLAKAGLAKADCAKTNLANADLANPDAAGDADTVLPPLPRRAGAEGR